MTKHITTAQPTTLYIPKVNYQYSVPNIYQWGSYTNKIYQFVLCRFLDPTEHFTNTPSWNLAYDKNRYANKEASWYSLHFVLYRTHESSCSCTRFEIYEPLRHSTCLLRLYSFCPKFKIRGKCIYFY